MSNEAKGGAAVRPYTLPEARWILSHVYCVICVPEDGDAGFSRPWAPGLGNCECCRCDCREPPDLRLWIASEAAGKAWLARENEAIEKHLAERAA